VSRLSWWRRFDWSIHFGWKHNAGLVCVAAGPWSVHVGVRRDHWTWGRLDDWYDGELLLLGAGPAILLTYCESVHWAYSDDEVAP